MKNTLTNRFIEKLSIVANKVSTQKHIMAIRDAFSVTIPVIIVAAVFLLINNVLLNESTGVLNWIPLRAEIVAVGDQIYNGTLGIMAIVIAFVVGYSLAKSYGENGVGEGVIAVCCYVTLIPAVSNAQSIDGVMFQANGVLTQDLTSSSGMFLALVASLVGVTLLCKIMKNEHLKIKMPDSVPPGIANSFNMLIPALMVLTIMGISEVLIVSLFHESIPELIVRILQTPLIGGFQTLPGILLYVFLAGFVWVFGIHGAFVFGAVASPVLLTSLQQNIDAMQAGLPMVNIVTSPFLNAFVYMGGGGTIISLVIAIFLASKREDYRMVTKIGLVPSIFNISEPLMFGLPVIFNPILGIPLVIAPLVSTILAYYATSWGFVDYTSIVVPWVTPPILAGYLATGGDIRAAILSIAIIAIDTLIYLPFVLASNRVAKLEEARRAKESEALQVES